MSDLCKWCDTEMMVGCFDGTKVCFHCDYPCRIPAGTCGRCAVASQRAKDA